MAEREDLQARERAAVADVVFTTLRHDLRNKFASIRNASFYLMRRMQKTDVWGTDPRVEAFFQLIDRELAAAEELLSSRGVAAPAGAAEPPRCRARDVAERALAQVGVPEGVRVERDWAETGEVAMAAEDLALLVRCLVENAVDAMPGGGTLAVRTRDAEGGVALRVEDTGEGLTEETRKRAFEPFFTTRPGHAGLGLSIVQRLVMRHGARMELGAGPAGGTHVEVLFFDETRGSK